jgi:solute carrier family 25 protein 39/40
MNLVLLNLGCGIFAGSAAAFFTTPGDVLYVKVVAQADRGVAGSARGGAGSAYQIANRLWSQEGLAGFFRGWQPRAIKVAPSCGIVIASYELFKRMVQV